jgi:hypothetical protein
MAVVAYPKVQTTIVWYRVIEEGNVFLSEDKEQYHMISEGKD